MTRPSFPAVILVLSIAGLQACATEEAKILPLSADEYDANQSYGEFQLRTRGAGLKEEALAPRIIVETPSADMVVSLPVDVVVRFQPAEGATIDLDSLSVQYGWFDITQRVRQWMEITQKGIEGKIGTMRQGKYSLKLSISDDQQRTTNTRITFRVTDPGS